MKLTEKENQARQLIIAEVEKAIMLVHAHLSKYCKDNNVKEVPIDYISGTIYVMLNAYKKGANGDTDKDTVPAGQEPG